MSETQDFEKLGAFYLGREHDVGSGETGDETILYDAKDLTTHAVCVGMTGSGKTGLCVSLLEEAAIDGIPAIVIDPKGDMGNLLLGFPDLAAASFEPWIDPGEARRKGKRPSELAADVAALWERGLADWGQDGARIRRFRESVDLAIYTPGSDAGLPLTVLRSFDAPPEAVRSDAEALGERIHSAAAGLLALVGVDADPLQSREAILVGNILKAAWQDGRGLELVDLIRQIQAPPFQRLGVLDLESFFPAKDRAKLAMQLNGVLASPSFASWLEGEALDVGRLLFTAGGKPRISILSIAHLSEAERMFFVTILLNEVVSWMRTQSGTSSLRAILYMDEILGYFPPSAEPPSKRPMLTLLKQARAFGLGCVLCTQNPVDLDYKGLANTGTWFIGRLQTERDKLRVLDGLEGAAAGLERAELDRLLSAVGKRVFLLHNVHEDRPVTFHTRWAMSYLRGPLTRAQIGALMAARKADSDPPSPATAAAATPAATSSRATDRSAAPAPAARPILRDGIEERFQARRGELDGGERLVYRPALRLDAKLHYADRTTKVDLWRDLAVTVELDTDDLDWAAAEVERGARAPDLRKRPEREAAFDQLPPAAERVKSYASWQKQLKTHLYQERTLTLYRSAKPKLVSEPDEAEVEFRRRLAEAMREERDLALEKLRQRYAPKLARLEERVRKAEQKVEKEEEQYRATRKSSWLRMGGTLVGSLFGRKLSTTVRELGTTMRSRDKASKERSDIERAADDHEARVAELAGMEAELQDAVAELEAPVRPDRLEIEERLVRPRKSDIQVGQALLVWRPWRVDGRGITEPAW